MAQFFSGASIWDIGQNLLMLSLDVVKPELGVFKAPSLTAADDLALRKWTEIWPTFEFFPYTEGMEFGETLEKLQALLPTGRDRTLIDWALRSTPLTDPSLDRQYDRPAHAANQWRDALCVARDANCLAALELSAAGQKTLLDGLTLFEENIRPAEALSKRLAKEWDPYPDDPQQFEYNRKTKSPWDRHIYETYCQFMSFHLEFDVVSTVRDQETHRFVHSYTALLPPSDHEKISTLLPVVLEGQGHYALHPWHLDRLRDFAELPLERLLPFARDPL